jgi:branched-chain amino acid transport system ATP-binding protein
MSAPDIILKLSNIESYYGPIMAIRGISIEVPRGERRWKKKKTWR